MYRFPTLLLSSLLVVSLALPREVRAVNVSSQMEQIEMESFEDATASPESLGMSSTAPPPALADEEDDVTASVQPVETSPTEIAAQENSASMSGGHKIWYDVALGAAAVAVATIAIWLVSDTGHSGGSSDNNKVKSTEANSQSTGGGA